MEAHDVMTTQVVTVRPATSVRDVAKLMVERGISGLPVVDDAGRIVGLVTDGDLCRRAELGTERTHRSFLDLLFVSRPDAAAYVEAHGRTANDVMTPDVIAVAPGTSLRQIAELFESRHIRRVPVVADDRLVGIVSRADLVRALASTPQATESGRLSDRHIRDLVMAAFNRLSWGLKSEWSVIVSEGIVHLWGFVPSESDRDALRVAAEAVPGVTGVEDHTLRYFGDAGPRPRRAPTVTVVGPDQSILSNLAR